VCATSLFGHLALQFDNRHELLATEALYYILASSPAARGAFVDYASQIMPSLPCDLTFRTQAAAADGAIPDLVAADEHNLTVLLIEAKFWAGLTVNQPVTYLQHLAQAPNGLLLFVAPAARAQTLWPELLLRCKSAGMPVEPRQDKELLHVVLAGDRHLAMVSWASLLTFLIHRLEFKGDFATAADVRQLVGLCDQMDQTAFLPLQPEELSVQLGKRLYQYCDLVDQLAAILVKEGIASRDGLRATAVKAWYGRYLKVYGRYDCLLKFDHLLWGSVRETPIWFRVRNNGDAKERLLSLELEMPPASIHIGDELLIPLALPLGVEREVVFQSLLNQITRVTNLLKC
jgi:hypothetical protein